MKIVASLKIAILNIQNLAHYFSLSAWPVMSDKIVRSQRPQKLMHLVFFITRSYFVYQAIRNYFFYYKENLDNTYHYKAYTFLKNKKQCHIYLLNIKKKSSLFVSKNVVCLL